MSANVEAERSVREVLNCHRDSALIGRPFLQVLHVGRMSADQLRRLPPTMIVASRSFVIARSFLPDIVGRRARGPPQSLDY